MKLSQVTAYLCKGFSFYFMNHVHVETCGNDAGPDLVLLHGWAMHSGVWDGVRERLAQQYRLHLVDLPGHGFSAGLIGESATLQHMAVAVAQVLPARSMVCGWSLGGQVAIELALRQPERVSQLMLVSTTPSFVQREDWQWAMEATVLQQFAAELQQDVAAMLKRFFALQVRGSSNASTALAQLRASLLQRGQPDVASLQTGLQVLLETDLRTQLHKITQPVTLLHGENDVIADPAAAKWMSQVLQNSKLIMLPRCGHAPFLSHPDKFMEIISSLSGTKLPHKYD